VNTSRIDEQGTLLMAACNGLGCTAGYACTELLASRTGICCITGMTKTINHFLMNDSWYLVDLPGYG